MKTLLPLNSWLSGDDIVSAVGMTNDDGLLTQTDGSVSALVHQYDRFARIRATAKPMSIVFPPEDLSRAHGRFLVTRILKTNSCVWS